MPGTMDKIKEKLHLNKNKEDTTTSANEPDFNHSTTFGHDGEAVPEAAAGRESFDSEMAAMDPKERADYLKEFEDAEKDENWTPKKGSLLDRLIAKGNKKTEDEIAAQQQLKAEEQVAKHDGVIR